MRQAIVTKFHGPTDTRGSRVSARAEAGRVMVSWDHRLNQAANHAEAANALIAKLGWEGRWICAGMPGTSGYVFVMDLGE